MTKLRPVTPLSILSAELGNILAEGQDALSTFPSLKEKLNRCHALASGLDPYLEASTAPEHQALRELQQNTLDYDWSDQLNGKLVQGLEPEMLSGHVEGEFLKMLVAISKARNILEIGVFSGYSVLAMALALPVDGKITACELDPRAASFAQNQFDQHRVAEKVELRVGPAIDTLEGLSQENRCFDMVFVDADKGNYKNYVEFILDQNLVRAGGFFVIDNTLLQGQVYLSKEERQEAGESIRLFNDYLVAEKRVDQVLVPLRDGVTLARRVN